MQRLGRPHLALLTCLPLVALATGCPDDGGSGQDEIGDTAGTDTDESTDSSDTESGSSDDTTDTSDTTDTTDTTDDTTDDTSDTTDDTSDTTDGTTDDTSDTDTSDTDTSDTDDSTTGEPPDDMDGDGIPDADDPFPNDPDLPGAAVSNLVYAHTSSRLFTMDPFTYEINEIGQFTFDQSNGQVTDIAIDRFGVLYAVTFNDVFVCHPQTAACYYLGDLPQSFNGLTMVPPGTIDENDDTLIGIANSGQWYQVTIVNQQAQLTFLGEYGDGMSSSGDVFSIEGVGTYGAVNAPGVFDGDVIVECDPTNGMVLDNLATTVGYTSLFGLAGWQGKIFGFNSGGQVIEINPENGTVTEVADSPHSWWGAGVFSVLPM